MRQLGCHIMLEAFDESSPYDVTRILFWEILMPKIAYKNYREFLIIYFLCICIHGCPNIRTLSDEEMQGYEVKIKLHESTALNDRLPELIGNFAKQQGFSEIIKEHAKIPDWAKCSFFYKGLDMDSNNRNQTNTVISIYYCQNDIASPKYPIDAGYFDVAVSSWRAEPVSVKTEIDRLGRMIYELIKSHGGGKMTLTQRRIGYR